MEKREFDNKFADYNGQKVFDVYEDDLGDGELHREVYIPAKFRKKLVQNILHHTQRLMDVLPELDESNYSVYTGTSGIAMLFEKLQKCEDVHHGIKRGQPHPDFHHMAMSLLKKPLKHLKGNKFTFLCGDAGPLALAAAFHSCFGETRQSSEYIERLRSMVKTVCSSKGIADEHLTGRVGFLYALLFVRNNCGVNIVKEEDVVQVFTSIIESGCAMSKSQGWCCPLLYEWHDSKYLGAAHGLAGIFYTLMQTTFEVPSLMPAVKEFVVPSIDYLMSLKFPSGNYPSSVDSRSGDKLVHWCHGAPGWIHMFIMAYKLLNEQKYLDAAKSCAEVIWKRGLLRKGYGLCHGVAGNGYAFLAMYNLTQDEKYMYMATKFAEWCFDYGKHGCGTPDRPYSLYEGLAGTIYFWADMLDPEKARFPGFELDFM